MIVSQNHRYVCTSDLRADKKLHGTGHDGKTNAITGIEASIGGRSFQLKPMLLASASVQSIRERLGCHYIAFGGTHH